jgi:hypothetical protein
LESWNFKADAGTSGAESAAESDAIQVPAVEEQKPLKSKAKALVRPRRQVDEVRAGEQGRLLACGCCLLAVVVYWRLLFLVALVLTLRPFLFPLPAPRQWRRL